ncbi:flavin reductase family protein [Saccharothrix violaceirubra]|uniref:Flavin reductase (DIM6/NTAB) family NADH-FMN oxidoreductase RutF n=1 Tax=Saccharothrix violaceirubra TaxID=413306 RepID=A0A7W7T2P8_9PSEU|nr:flavin reductase family protein [Saccharothrix violaceirubra]MBB4965421.1 flavin reductase (DIM6/NTAB) family NADH-FMN oxidoreductase RutF [Saccharothrix violaceirubra]
MAGFPTGVAVVTAVDADGTPHGMTCSSLCSVTLLPPTLAVCLRRGSPTLAAIQRRNFFVVNLMHDEARITAELFASGEADRFDRVRWQAGAAGPHLPDDAHAIADCSVRRTEPVGDHEVVFGEVLGAGVSEMPKPLLYGMRRYARLWTEAGR